MALTLQAPRGHEGLRAVAWVSVVVLAVVAVTLLAMAVRTATTAGSTGGGASIFSNTSKPLVEPRVHRQVR